MGKQGPSAASAMGDHALAFSSTGRQGVRHETGNLTERGLGIDANPKGMTAGAHVPASGKQTLTCPRQT